MGARRCVLAGLIGLAALAAAPGAARADNFEEFGFGARAQGMGGAFTALASDYTATYYNPGGLILSRHLNLGFGFSFADYLLEVDTRAGGQTEGDAERIPDLSAFTLGISKTIPLDIPDRLAFGLGVFLPTRGIINLKARAPDRQPEWFRYGERHDRIHLLPAAAVKITRWLSFGAGASVFVDAVGGTTISAGITSPVQPDFKLKLKPDLGVVLGVMVAPADWISFGLTYRQEHSFKLDFPALANVQGIQLPLRLETITFYQPHQLQFGVAINVTDHMVVAFDLAWFHWSAFDDPFLVVSSTVAAVPPQPEVDFQDSFSPRLGFELNATEWMALRWGYWYRSGIIDDQTDQTNLIDSGKHVFTLGAGFSWGKAPERVSDEARGPGAAAETMEQMLVDASYDLDLFFQYHLHEEASESRPLTDPVGSWDAGGGIINFGFTFIARF